MAVSMTDPRALRERLLQLDAIDRRAVLSSLPTPELHKLLREWHFWRRDNQTPPSGNWRWWLILAGRGFGKTRTGAEYIRERVRDGMATRIALVGRTVGDVREVMVEGPSGILAVSPPSERPEYNPSMRRLTWPNGAIATTFSSENPEQARGPEHDLVWGDETATWGEGLFSNIDLGLRQKGPKGDRAHGILTTTPKPVPIIRQLTAEPRCIVTRGSTYDNVANLDSSFMEIIERTYDGTRLGRQEVWAELLDDVEGALWTLAMLDETRVRDFPELARLVISIDPATTANATSDETGIIVCGAGIDGDGYVLEDLSCKLSPAAWAKRAVDAYWDWKADEIVAEVNQGGDMVEATIKAVDPRVPVRKVNARRGKFVRAEPVAALYEQKRMHHVGTFKLLEAQMTSWTGVTGERSPDRMDALVHGATAVMLNDPASLLVGFA
jgi:phage terminase large subunit-like protein